MSVAVFLVRTWCTSQFCPCLSFLLVVKASTSCCWQTWKKKVQRVQTMIYTSAVVFVPYLDVEKRFLQHSIMAQSCMFGSTTMGQQDYFCSKNLWPGTFSVVFELFISFMPNLQPQLFSYLHTIWFLEKNASLKNCVFGTNAIKQAWKFSACKRSLSFNKTGPLS